MPFGLWTRVVPRNHVLDGGPDWPCEGAILRRKGWPIVNCGDAMPWAVQKWLNQSSWRSACGLGWTQGAYIDGCALAPPGKYNWTVHVWQRCSLNLKLLWPLVDIIVNQSSVDVMQYTHTGKKVEVAVKKILNGEDVKVRSAYVNPDSLDLYYNIPELLQYWTCSYIHCVYSTIFRGQLPRVGPGAVE